MHATCEIKGCDKEAAFSVGSHFFCKTHQEEINGRLLAIKNADIETSHHLDGSNLEHILESYESPTQVGNIQLEKEDEVDGNTSDSDSDSERED
jgi:hypothetical protein